MRHHDLKCWPEYYAPVNNGLKAFELRKDDRDYQVGDTVTLKEWNPETGKYTGNEMGPVTISYIIRDTPYLAPGYCAFSWAENEHHP